ncbi:hypothetical protein HHL24_41395 [Paraburkholderia sp. RP-4-7]|uniref:Glycosyl hydrolases family 39 N-terminal catalytic domain-containing protein n=1 Tax=Paraburkholderia polaris TaxID=2728848 RepID=A0A848IPV6_9BURK|nr:glycosyl hydrolase [Paraburkholderia polaris]NMM04292.1 hypothetical protein [Paraburkholderia polaris]
MKITRNGAHDQLRGRRDALKRLGGMGLMSVSGVLLDACGGSGLGASGAASAADQAAALGYRLVSVNAGSNLGVIRSLQGVNGPPVPAYLGVENIPPGTTPTANIFNPEGLDLTSVYSQMGINFVRTHDLDADGTGDIGGTNINRIFPDWSADPLNPANYNFAPTDTVIAGIIRSNSSVFFSLGRSDRSMVGLPNNSPPPTDFAQYAAVAKQIVLHYNHGWANGFNYGIQYWEIWNEPDMGWTSANPPQQYYEFYQQLSTAIKSVDPTLKVGGPTTVTNNVQYGLMGSFLQFIQGNSLPLDFYSFHWYPFFNDPLDFIVLANQYRTLLNQYGFSSTELHLNEWNYSLSDTPAPEQLAAFVATSLTSMQDAPIDRSCCYQRTAPLLQNDGSLTKAGSAFAAVGGLAEMFRLTTSGQDDKGYSVLAGRSADQSEVHILISNYQIPAADLGPNPGGNSFAIPGLATFILPDRRTISYASNAGYYVIVEGLPWGSRMYSVSRYRIDSSNQMTLIDARQTNGAECVISAALPPPSVELIVLKAV